MASINTANFDPAVKKVLQDMLSDLTALRTAFTALTAKLDTNHAAATDHASTLDPASLLTTK